MLFKRASEVEELHQILKIQRENQPSILSLSERKKEGFVTVSHSLKTLVKLNDVCPHIVAKDSNKVVGYALCMHHDFSNEIEVLRPMFDQINTILSKNTSYIVMGQICIAKDYRKMGVFRKLYKKMKDEIQHEFECIITQVDAKNSRSLNAHYAVGFVNLKTYSSNNREWKLIILK